MYGERKVNTQTRSNLIRQRTLLNIFHANSYTQKGKCSDTWHDSTHLASRQSLYSSDWAMKIRGPWPAWAAQRFFFYFYYFLRLYIIILYLPFLHYIPSYTSPCSLSNSELSVTALTCIHVYVHVYVSLNTTNSVCVSPVCMCSGMVIWTWITGWCVLPWGKTIPLSTLFSCLACWLCHLPYFSMSVVIVQPCT